MIAKGKSTLVVSLSPNTYAGSALSSGTINLIELAVHYEFLILDKGFNSDSVWQPNRRARIKPTAKLHRLLGVNPSGPQIIDAIVTRPDELIKLRRTVRETIPYKKNGITLTREKKKKTPVPREEWEKKKPSQDKREELQALERSLESFNSLLQSAEITYTSKEDNRRHTLHPALFCSYTDDFEHGGRFYTGKGGHMNLPKIERDTIEFNGQPTAELDYGGLHIRILYHMAGTEYPCEDDPYKDVLQTMGKSYEQLQRVFGEEFAKEIRNDLKLVLLTLVGDKTKEHIQNPVANAAGKINHNLFRKWEDKTDPETIEEEKRKNLECKARWDEAGLLNRDGSTYDVVKAFVAAHQRIKDYFLKGFALNLQNIDAKMALHVMNQMMVNEADECVPALPVHDSFITLREEPYPQRLRTAMETAYREVMQEVTSRDTEFRIPIKPTEDMLYKPRKRA